MKDYSDIIDLPHPTSQKHKRMSLHDRAAQFAPFAALTGYDDAVEETARVTDEQSFISNDEIEALDASLRRLSEIQRQNPLICITYFEHDTKKSGGKYITCRANLKKIDDIEKCVTLTDGRIIPFSDIVGIEENS